jgi:mono/diheme cytochrome c family protein
VVNAVAVNHLRFPFNQRWSMAAWRELYFDEGGYEPDAAKSAQWNRGAYLVEGLGHCSACHSPRNALGGIEKDKAYTGATVDGWFALNLTSNLHTGLGSWSADGIATYLKTGAVPGKTTALGPMALVVKNSTSQMSDADRAAMATYLKDIPPNSTLRSGKPAPDPTRVAGATLYMDHCGGCHQAGGRGLPGVFPPLAGNGVVRASDPSNILKVCRHKAGTSRCQPSPACSATSRLPSWRTTCAAAGATALRRTPAPRWWRGCGRRHAEREHRIDDGFSADTTPAFAPTAASISRRRRR